MKDRAALIEIIESAKTWVPGPNVFRYEASAEATADAILAAGYRKQEP